MATEGIISHYFLLRVELDATNDDIKRGFRAQSRTLHPDKHPRASKRERAAFTAKFQKLTEARDCLLNESTRSIYDTSCASMSFTDPKDPARFFREQHEAEMREREEAAMRAREEERARYAERRRRERGDVGTRAGERSETAHTAAELSESEESDTVSEDIEPELFFEGELELIELRLITAFEQGAVWSRGTERSIPVEVESPSSEFDDSGLFDLETEIEELNLNEGEGEDDEIDISGLTLDESELTEDNNLNEQTPSQTESDEDELEGSELDESESEDSQGEDNESDTEDNGSEESESESEIDDAYDGISEKLAASNQMLEQLLEKVNRQDSTIALLYNLIEKQNAMMAEQVVVINELRADVKSLREENASRNSRETASSSNPLADTSFDSAYDSFAEADETPASSPVLAPQREKKSSYPYPLTNPPAYSSGIRWTQGEVEALRKLRRDKPGMGGAWVTSHHNAQWGTGRTVFAVYKKW